VVSAVVSVGCFCFFTLAVNGSFLISSMTALGTLPPSGSPDSGHSLCIHEPRLTESSIIVASTKGRFLAT
jgi:hypothetical protein